MQFDDRLATVLRQPATSKVISRIQYRQLLDLLGTSPTDAHGAQIDAAYDVLARLSRQIAPSERARLLGEPGLRLRSPRLVALLAEDDTAVAAAAISAAEMTEEDWLDLIPALPVQARGLLRHRRDLGPKVEARLERLGITDRGLPPSDRLPSAARTAAPRLRIVETEPARERAVEDDGIGALVRKIEAFRKTREGAPVDEHATDSPRLPLGENGRDARRERLTQFDFATDARGRVIWADPAAAPMAVGLHLASRRPESPVKSSLSLAEAIRLRQPIVAGQVHVTAAPQLTGDWIVDAAPCFDEVTGRFTGHVGRARRPFGEWRDGRRVPGEGDRMRQTLHELRTPVGAIQLGAEMIQQQIYGPTPHEYRAIAAAIASDSARILAAFEELERLVKLDGGVLDLEAGESDLAEVAATAVAHLHAHTDPRRSGFVFETPEEPLAVCLARAELERLVWRLLASLAGAAAPSELLPLDLRDQGGAVLLEIGLPVGLAALSDEELFHARAGSWPQALSAGMFGLGFSLRLARAEASSAGGSLIRQDGGILLSLPGLTEASANLSQG